MRVVIFVALVHSVVSFPPDMTAMSTIGGKPTNNDYKYHVSVQHCTAIGHCTHICSGIIIHDQWVLSVAHCTELNRNGLFQIVAGTLKLVGNDKSLQIIAIERQLNHADYNSRTMKADIALFKLSRRLTFGANVGKIMIHEHSLVGQGTQCVVAGWGKTASGVSSNDLLEITLPLVSKDTCIRFYSKCATPITEEHICTGPQNQNEQHQGPDIADSGGPLLCKGKLIGLVSFKKQCGTNMAVYTRVSSYTQWIRKSIQVFSASSRVERPNILLFSFLFYISIAQRSD